jgi:membrane dipeptidase
MSIYTPAQAADEGRSKALADQLIDLVEGLARKSPKKFELARSSADVRRSAAAGRIALLLGMENGSPLEGKLENLDHFYARGVRYITLCHSKDNLICDSSYDKSRTHKGLSTLGREVVLRMNELGIMVDVSHISDDSFWQVLRLTQVPVIASHSSLRHFVPEFERNMSDEMVAAVAKNGGVVMINFGSSFLTTQANQHFQLRAETRKAIAAQLGLDEGAAEVGTRMAEWDMTHRFQFATVSDVANHIDRAVILAGIRHVGLGSDFDGVGDSLPLGLKSVADYPNLIAELLRRGYSDEDIGLLCGENVLRVLDQVGSAATKLQQPLGPMGDSSRR